MMYYPSLPHDVLTLPNRIMYFANSLNKIVRYIYNLVN